MAFGMAQGEQRIGLAELRRLLDGIAAQGRLTITLDAAGDFARPEIRMLVLAVMCMESAMPWGGRVIVLRDGPQWRLVAECDRSKVDPTLWGWLDGPQPRTLAPSEVHFALLAEAARAENRPLRHEFDDTGGRDRVLGADRPVARDQYLKLVNCSAPTAPRACILPVAMPISAPMPNSPPSANWVEAFRIRIALSNPAKNRSASRHPRSGSIRCAGCHGGGYGRWPPRPVHQLGGDDHVKNSRPKSSGLAGTVPGMRARSPSARTSTPASSRVADQDVAMAVMERPVDQQAFGRPADTCAPRLGVQHHAPRLFQIGRGVGIDVADPLQMRKDRHAGLVLHQPDQPLAAARDDHVDQPLRAQHGADRRAVARGHHLDGGFRQARRAKTLDHAGMDRAAGMQAFRTAAQITAFPDFNASAPASAVTFGRLS